MDNLRLLERIREDSAVLVAGKDMFGAQFTERTQLMELSAQGLVFALYRPLVEDLTLRVHLRADQEEASLWVKGIVTKVRNRLDGMQTVEMQTIEVSLSLPDHVASN
jgi:hypothetical protein